MVDDSGGRPTAGRPAAAAWPGGPAASESPPTGRGASANDSVRVTIGADGLVDTVTIDPRAFRKGSEVVAELTREAIREAQRDWFGRLAEHDPAPGAEDRLRTRLEEIQADYSRRMEEINRAMAALMRQR
jgi:YbaB/EbfC DNA-binding family protein